MRILELAPIVPVVAERLPTVPDVAVSVPMVPDVAERVVAPMDPDVVVRLLILPVVAVSVPTVSDVAVSAPMDPDTAERVPVEERTPATEISPPKVPFPARPRVVPRISVTLTLSMATE